MGSLNRRRFLHAAGVAAAAGCAGDTHASGRADAKPRKYRLGIVTYNIAATWDLPTILRMCRSVGLSPVELRTSHKHDVEPSLTPDQRKEVRRRFADKRGARPPGQHNEQESKYQPCERLHR
jgi:hypothetical protein